MPKAVVVHILEATNFCCTDSTETASSYPTTAPMAHVSHSIQQAAERPSQATHLLTAARCPLASSSCCRVVDSSDCAASACVRASAALEAALLPSAAYESRLAAQAPASACSQKQSLACRWCKCHLALTGLSQLVFDTAEGALPCQCVATGTAEGRMMLKKRVLMKPMQAHHFTVLLRTKLHRRAGAAPQTAALESPASHAPCNQRWTQLWQDHVPIPVHCAAGAM